MNGPNDTIAAVATPPGAGGIGIVRVSGPAALAVAGRIFRGRGGRALADTPPHQLRRGTVVEPGSGEAIDEALAVRMPEGRSYTGEPTVEVHAHGGRAVLEAVLRAALAAGARLAEPGEFTKRAFLGGRLDLSQAEAVAALVEAESEIERRSAFAQLQGGVGASVRAARDRLAETLAATEALLDFGDEDGAGEPPEPAAIVALAAELRALAGEGRAAHAARRGPRVVIAGPPNVGKSCIFNMLSARERSIVAPTPGTTRDYLEERAVVAGATVTLVDTAGLRQAADPVEAEGVARSRRQIADADVVVLVVDGAAALTAGDLELIDTLRARSPMVVVNKEDLPAVADRGMLRRIAGDLPLFPLSARTGAGFAAFAGALAARSREASPDEAGALVVPNLRHQEALFRAAEALDAARDRLGGGRPLLDLVAADLRLALAAVDEITGQGVAEDVLDRIFSRFCVGK